MKTSFKIAVLSLAGYVLYRIVRRNTQVSVEVIEIDISDSHPFDSRSNW